jgi:hypothetical protein
MARKEKGRPAGGDPIPTTIRQDVSEFISQPFDLQVFSAAAAGMLAPLIFGEAAL